MKEFAHKIDGSNIVAVGSSNVEQVFRLAPGSRHEADTVQTANKVETTFGGGGLCNAVALNRTGVFDEVTFVSAAGKRGDSKDAAAKAIEGFLTGNNIFPSIQYHEGDTETAMIVLSGADNDSKRGFRLAGKDGLLLRDLFNVDKDVKDTLGNHSLVVASSFSPNVVISMASAYRDIRGSHNGLFVWTINKDSATAVGTNSKTQKALREGLIDVICMSDREEYAMKQTPAGEEAITHVPIRLVTKGSEGCEVSINIDNKRHKLHIPAFRRVTYVVNDNGAGEAHHANFIAGLTTMHHNGNGEQLSLREIATAAEVANLAAYLKIRQADSLWFPSLKFANIPTAISLGKAPREIAEGLYNEFQKKTTDYDTYSVLSD